MGRRLLPLKVWRSRVQEIRPVSIYYNRLLLIMLPCNVVIVLLECSWQEQSFYKNVLILTLSRYRLHSVAISAVVQAIAKSSQPCCMQEAQYEKQGWRIVSTPGCPCQSNGSGSLSG